MKQSFKAFLAERDIELKIEYHDKLNPMLWDNLFLKDKVKSALDRIADEFIKFLEISPTSVSDIIITGSNCGYNYTDQSDIDLHLVIDFNVQNFCPTCTGDFIQDCFQAKKTLWNENHDITIYGYDVELYAQDAAEQHIAPGVYSLKSNQWIIKPEYKIPSYDDFSVKAKAEELMNTIDNFIDSNSDDVSGIQDVKDKIRKMRQAGLHSDAGLYSVENLVFKTLRNSGYLQKLSDYLLKIEDNQLSLED